MTSFLSRDIHFIDEYAEPLYVLESGYQAFDDQFRGFYSGELTFIAGRPGSGLRLVLSNLAINQSVNASRKTLFFTTDLSGPELSGSILQQLTGKGLMARRWKHFEDTEEIKKLNLLPDSLADCPFYIEDQCFNIKSMMAKAVEVNAAHNLDLIIIDDLTTVSKTEKGEPFSERRSAEQLSNLSQSLKIPVITGVRLKPLKLVGELEENSFPMPGVNELNDMSILNYAGKLIFLHIPDYYMTQGADDHKCHLSVIETTTNKNAVLLIPFDYKKGLLADTGSGKLPNNL